MFWMKLIIIEHKCQTKKHTSDVSPFRNLNILPIYETNIYPLVVKHGNGTSLLNGGFNRNITCFYGSFSIANVSLPEGRSNTSWMTTWWNLSVSESSDLELGPGVFMVGRWNERCNIIWEELGPPPLIKSLVPTSIEWYITRIVWITLMPSWKRSRNL